MPGIHHEQEVCALEKAGYHIVRQGKHIVMSDGVRVLTIPRSNPITIITMGGIARDAGLTVDQFRNLLCRPLHTPRACQHGPPPAPPLDHWLAENEHCVDDPVLPPPLAPIECEAHLAAQAVADGLAAGSANAHAQR